MPIGLLAASALLWAWQLGQLWLGVLVACLVEAPRLLAWRIDLAEGGARVLAWLGNLLLFGVLGYGATLASSRDPAFAILSVAACLPIVALPPLLAQLWGDDAGIDLRAFLPGRRGAHKAPLSLPLAWPFWVLCLLAATSVPGVAASDALRAKALYPALCLLLCWGMWSRRRADASVLRWVLAMLCAAALGLAVHLGLNGVQGELETHFGEWFLGMESGGDSDPSRSSTAIGRIGSLKLSERIVLRVKSDTPLRLPLLLREASYDHYMAASWMAARPAYRSLPVEGGSAGWRMAEGGEKTSWLAISHALKKGQGLLALPVSAVALRGVSVGKLERSRFGTVVVSDGPPRLDYRVAYLPDAAVASDAPTENDLEVPAQLARLFAETAAELKLAGRPPAAAAEVVRDYFQRQFRYSLVQREGVEVAPLAYFMRQSRAGHCEYFATATVLLLRSAGIPARYATGYSLQEYSSWEKAYVARARHAHAWAEVYVDGVWRNLDTTPARWAELEAAQRLPWQGIADLANWLLDRLAAGWAAFDAEAAFTWLGWGLGAVLLYLVWRLRRGRWLRRRGSSAPVAELARQGADSEWYAFAARLEAAGLTRPAWEPLSVWAKRIAQLQSLEDAGETLDAVIQLHYRHRFDPQGLSAAERQALREGLARLCALVQADQSV